MLVNLSNVVDFPSGKSARSISFISSFILKISYSLSINFGGVFLSTAFPNIYESPSTLPRLLSLFYISDSSSKTPILLGIFIFENSFFIFSY